jgi:hypothetical protein
MGTYGICRTDNLTGHAFGYDFDTDIENGLLAEIDHATDKIVVTTNITYPQVLVASVCNQYDSKDESDFINSADSGLKARTFDLPLYDVFTTTQFSTATGDHLTYATITVGDYVIPVVGGKFGCFTATSGTSASLECRVIGKTTLNTVDAIQLRVVKNIKYS